MASPRGSQEGSRLALRGSTRGTLATGDAAAALLCMSNSGSTATVHTELLPTDVFLFLEVAFVEWLQPGSASSISAGWQQSGRMSSYSSFIQGVLVDDPAHRWCCSPQDYWTGHLLHPPKTSVRGFCVVAEKRLQGKGYLQDGPGALHFFVSSSATQTRNGQRPAPFHVALATKHLLASS